MKISAKAKVKILDAEGKDTGEETEVPIEAEYDFGDTIHQLIENHGEEATFHHGRSSMIVAFQTALRSWASAGLSGEELTAKVDAWEVPTGRSRGLSRIERFKSNLNKLSEEERKEVLAELGLAPA